MRIVFVNSLYPPRGNGGAEQTLRGLAEALVERGWTVFVLTLTPNKGEPRRTMGGAEVISLRPRTAMWPFSQKASLWRKVLFQLSEIYNPWMARAVGRELDVIQPDVVHVHNFKGFSASIWTAARRRGIPLVQTLHDYTLVCPRSVMMKKGVNCGRQCGSCRVFSIYRRHTASQPDAFTAVSRRMVARMRSGQAPTTSRPTYLIRGDNPPSNPVPARSPSQPFTFGFLGRLEATKGIDLLLEAIGRPGLETCRLLVAGAGDPVYEKRLEALSAAGGRISYLGWSHPQTFFAAVDVLVVPSLWEEPLGRVAHEAFGYGVPVLASRSGGLSEIISAGVNGDLFRLGDADDLARKMIAFASDLAALGRLRQGALDAAGEFDASLIHHTYESVLRSVLPGARGDADAPRIALV